MRNRREHPPVNASNSSAGQNLNFTLGLPTDPINTSALLQPYDLTPQNYTPVPPTNSIIPSDLHHPYNWRPREPYIIQDTTAYPDLPIYQNYTPVLPASSIIPSALHHPYDWRVQNYTSVLPTSFIIPSSLRRPYNWRPHMLYIIQALSVYPDQPTYQNYISLLPTDSIIPRALRHPYDWRPQEPYIIPATSVYPDLPTYQNYTSVPPTSSVIPSALHHPYDWRPQVPSEFTHINRAPSINPDRATYQNDTPVTSTSSINPSVLDNFYDWKPQVTVPDSILAIYAGKGKTSEDTDIPQGSLASGIELRRERGYSGSEASCEGSDADYQYGSPPRARDHQSSSGGTPQMGNLTRMNEPSQPVLGYPMTTGAVLALPVPGGLTRRTTNLSPILPTCSEITSTAVPTTLVSVPSETCMQDTQELERQLKLEAGRESARQELPKKAELDGLIRRADFLTMESASLIAEIRRLQEETELFLALNVSLQLDIEEILMEIEGDLEEILMEIEGDQQQNPESNEERADDQQQNPDSNEKRADDHQQNPDSNEK